MPSDPFQDQIVPSSSSVARGTTELMHAVMNQNIDQLKLTIAKDKTIDVQNDNGFTALMYAVRTGNEKKVDLLLDAGAKTDLQNKEGKTALMLAVDDEKVGISRMLVEAVANLDLQDSSGFTALMFAAIKGNVNIAEILMAANRDMTTTSGKTALMLAAGEGKVDMLRYLLAMDSNVNLQDNSGMTALDFANRNADAAKVLSEHSAAPEASSPGGSVGIVKSFCENIKKCLPEKCLPLAKATQDDMTQQDSVTVYRQNSEKGQIVNTGAQGALAVQRKQISELLEQAIFIESSDEGKSSQRAQSENLIPYAQREIEQRTSIPVIGPVTAGRSVWWQRVAGKPPAECRRM